MEISLLLLEQIVKLFLMIFMGFIIVKTGLLRAEASRTLSLVTLYIVTPCTVIDAFQVDGSPEITRGLLTAFLAALILHAALLLLSKAAGKIFRLDAVERSSAMYSNAGNMILPIIISMLGPEWAIYCCAFMSVQIVFFWTQLRMMFLEERKPDVKKIVTNPNMIAIAAGIVLYLLQIRIPAILLEPISSVGKMIGPLSMFVTGMLIADTDLKKILRSARIYLVVFLRLIAFPLCLLPVVYAVNRLSGLQERNKVMMIVFLAVMAPCATTIVQMSHVCGKDGKYASAINVLSVLLCIVTMPLMIGIYNVLMPVL